MVITEWLPSGLGPGGESDEAEERYGVKTIYRSGQPGAYWEVKVLGSLENVVKAVLGWWDCGNEIENEEMLPGLLNGLKRVDEGAYDSYLAGQAAAAVLGI